MPFLTRFYNPCLVSADTSIQSSIPPRSFSSIKTFLSLRLFKKRPTTTPYPTKSSSRSRPLHVRKVRSTKESSAVLQNYDMTILHEDELDNTRLAVARRRKKKIPAWATQEELELAVINQVYFQKIEPEDIFGRVCIDHARDLINSMLMEH